MKMYPLFEVINQLNSKNIFAIDLIQALKDRKLHLYFNYSGYIGFSDNIYYVDDLKENIKETKYYEGFIAIDVNSNRINYFYEILEMQSVDEIVFEKGILDGRLAFFINTNINEIPVMYGNIFGKLVNNVEVRGVKIIYRKIYISEKDFNNLLKEVDGSNNVNFLGSEMDYNPQDHLDEIISKDKEYENIDDNKTRPEKDEFRYPSEDYLNELSILNEKYGIEIPDKIFVALEAYLKIYLDKQYESQSKNTKLSHNAMFERCIETFKSRYHLNETVTNELRRFTNPKPQEKIKIKIK